MMNLNGIDLNPLVAFDAPMAERSVTRAGACIGRTQSAMGAALAQLRALLHDDLLIRGPAELQPTPRAVDLVGPLGRALANMQRTLEFTHEFDPASSTRAFRLGLAEHTAFVVMPLLFERLAEVAPGIALQIRSYVSREQARALLDAGEVDLVVGVMPAQATGRFLTRPLFDEPFICILRDGHAAANGPLDMRTLLTLSQLLVSPENDHFGYVDAALSKLGLGKIWS